MLLRFRRHCVACFTLLAFETAVTNSGLFAQEVSPDNQRNTLRLGGPAGTAKSAIQASQNVPTGPSQVDVVSKDTDDQAMDEIKLVSPLVMKIATATMSHVSPFFWFMAGPTSDLEIDSAEVLKGIVEEIADEPIVDSQPIDQVPGEPLPKLAERKLAVVENEPPRMTVQEEPVLDLSLSDEMATDESDEEDEVAVEEPKKVTVESAPRKPAPRPIRIPFDNVEEEKPSPKNLATQKQGTPRDKDSQQDQEEPQLDPRNNRSGREDQGIDALKASKPISDRREIRIDDPKNEGIQVAPIVQSKPSDPVLANRLQRTEACLAFYLDHPESTSVRSPWAVMHALLAFGGDYEMVHGQGRVNAIGWMCHNGTCRTQRMFTPTTAGFKPNVGDGVQGHEGQFLAILAQSNVPLNYPIQIGSSKYTVEDLVRYEMATCKEKSELTFKLIGLSYYLDSNKQWRANDGKIWSISKLIQEELSQPIIGAACGGVHRLMGFSFSVRQRQLQGLQVNGQYARAAKFVKEYIDYTWQLQNPDGSFSTSWYEGRANEPNEERKVQTTGHMLEWLMYTLSDEEIKSPRVGKSIDFLLSKILDKRDHKWPIGPRGHATRAVALYHARTKETLGQPSRSLPVNSAVKTGPAPIRK
ncbi:MAG: hypothetical protein NTY15_10545 [Planctomycetota bacterium]|nr:hypothetical protein [Planctomycetota bacterium]